MSELTPQQILADHFGSTDFPTEIFNPALEAAIVIQLLEDHGFLIVPAGN